MGTNRRYADAIDRKMDDRVHEVVMRDNEPASLTPAELELDEEPITKPPRARPVLAWVRYGDVPIRVDAEVVAWTSRAAAIRWRTPAGDVHKAWVWMSGVTDRQAGRAPGAPA